MQLQGCGCGGRGNIPSPAQRFRSRLEFSEQETLTAIVNRDFARFVFPHQHAALGRRPVLTLPFQLQQPMVIAHHPILTYHGGSDRLVDAIVAWGDLDAIRSRIRAHQSAGADHVCIQALTANPNSLPLQEWRELASALIERA